MEKQFNYLLSLMCILILLGCSQSSQKRHAEFRKWQEHNGKLKILSTTSMINDLVKTVGGDKIDTLVLIQGDLDPHSYQLVKGDDEKLGFADLILYNGLGLEHGASLHHHLSYNPKAVPLGDLIVQKNPNLAILVDGNLDPHIWTDVSAWSQTIPFIIDELSKKLPQYSEEFKVNGQQLQQNLAKLHEELKDILLQVPDNKRYLVTSHDAFNYFSRAYLATPKEIANGKWSQRFAAPEGLSPDSQLSATHIRQIIDYLKEYDIHLLFPESNVSRDSIKKIVQAAQDQGLDVAIACCPLYGDAMGPEGSEGDTYIKMQRYNAQTLADHMLDAPHPVRKLNIGSLEILEMNTESNPSK